MVAILAFSAIIPIISGSTIEPKGYVTYDPDGSKEPIKILAIWETTWNGSDDDLFKPGCQINPPMSFNASTEVWVYMAIWDPDNDVTHNNQIKVDISWPDNGWREELGIGGLKDTNLHPVEDATWEEYLAAHAIDVAPNWPFICYYNQANDSEGYEGYDFIHWATFQNDTKFKKVKYEPYYHDPAGWYDAHITIQGQHIDIQMNYWEYVLGVGVEIDFNSLDWGEKTDLFTWYKYDGDHDFDNPPLDPPMPTIRSIGNWDSVLGANFTNGTFDINDILFDIRAGDESQISSKYNQSFVEANSPDHHPEHYIGMYPNRYYEAIPIDNYEMTGEDIYNDTLLKCHYAKLDLYIYPIQWTHHDIEYEFDIKLYARSPDTVLPVDLGGPCPIET